MAPSLIFRNVICRVPPCESFITEEISLSVSVCADRRGLGIVCHQQNSCGETNEEYGEKEGGILIGLSLPSVCLFSSSPWEKR